MPFMHTDFRIIGVLGEEAQGNRYTWVNGAQVYYDKYMFNVYPFALWKGFPNQYGDLCRCQEMIIASQEGGENGHNVHNVRFAPYPLGLTPNRKGRGEEGQSSQAQQQAPPTQEQLTMTTFMDKTNARLGTNVVEQQFQNQQ
ncbi:hypothetical protein Lal_00012405 [Lupinus albus]|nr:hypothetical protein Lal_00012405 [Lupinus albus]